MKRKLFALIFAVSLLFSSVNVFADDIIFDAQDGFVTVCVQDQTPLLA